MEPKERDIEKLRKKLLQLNSDISIREREVTELDEEFTKILSRLTRAVSAKEEKLESLDTKKSTLKKKIHTAKEAIKELEAFVEMELPAVNLCDGGEKGEVSQTGNKRKHATSQEKERTSSGKVQSLFQKVDSSVILTKEMPDLVDIIRKLDIPIDSYLNFTSLCTCIITKEDFQKAPTQFIESQKKIFKDSKDAPDFFHNIPIKDKYLKSMNKLKLAKAIISAISTYYYQLSESDQSDTIHKKSKECK